MSRKLVARRVGVCLAVCLSLSPVVIADRSLERSSTLRYRGGGGGGESSSATAWELGLLLRAARVFVRSLSRYLALTLSRLLGHCLVRSALPPPSSSPPTSPSAVLPLAHLPPTLAVTP